LKNALKVVDKGFNLCYFLVDYSHAQTLVTVLMVACVSGTVKAVEKLLKLGANVWKMSCDELTALDWSKRFTKTEAAELLECYKYSKRLLPFRL
jgi:hypothetical protein